MKCSLKSTDGFTTSGVPWNQDGDVLDILVQSKRDKGSGQEILSQATKGLRYVPHAIITAQLRSYGAAKAEMLPSVEHLQQKYLNNRAENSHQPTKIAGARDETVQVSGTRAVVFFRPSASLLRTSEWGDTCTELMVIGK